MTDSTVPHQVGDGKPGGTLEAARRYRCLGWYPIAWPRGVKGGNQTGWQDLRLDDDDLPHDFGGGENLGILLGIPPGNLIDIDVDAPEARALAPSFLPSTDLVFGHVSAPRSHYVYSCDPPLASEDFQLIIQRKPDKLVEYRSTGRQTIFPPSIWTDADDPARPEEVVRFDVDGEPARVDAALLRERAAHLAAAAVLVRFWPGPGGGREDAALALAGGLLSCGWDINEATAFVRLVAETAGDPWCEKRGLAVRDTAKRHAAGKPATGWSRLGEMIGRDVRDKVREWLGGRVVSAVAPQATQDTPTIFFVRADTVRPEPTQWMKRGTIPLKAVTVIAGDPGLGKSTAAIDDMARLTRGTLPGDLFGTPVDVVIASAEDHRASVLVPRLMAADADLARAHFVEVRETDGLVRGLIIPDDLPLLESEMRRTGARALLVDPLVAHLPPTINSWKDQDVRRAMAPLVLSLCEPLGAAVVVIAHLNKREVGNVLARISGAGGIGAAARSVLFAAPDPQDDTKAHRILAHAKCNVGPIAASVRFRIDPRFVHGEDGLMIETSVIAWLDEAPDLHAADLLREQTPEEQSALADAIAWIEEAIADVDLPSTDAFREARKVGIAERTLRRAKDALKETGRLYVKKPGFKTGWVWSRTPPTEDAASTAAPKEPNEQGQDAHRSALATLAPFDGDQVPSGSHADSEEDHAAIFHGDRPLAEDDHHFEEGQSKMTNGPLRQESILRPISNEDGQGGQAYKDDDPLPPSARVRKPHRQSRDVTLGREKGRVGHGASLPPEQTSLPAGGSGDPDELVSLLEPPDAE